MKPETHDYIVKLEEFYAHDQASLDNIRKLRKQFTTLEYKKAMNDNPAIQDLQRSCIDRSKVYLKILLSPSEHTEKQLISAEVGLLWAKFFLQAVGGDPESSQKSVENIIERYAQKANITSKEG